MERLQILLFKKKYLTNQKYDTWRRNSTLFQVQNCHVIKYFPRHEHNGKTACVIVGAGLGNPYLKNENYLDYCLDAGVSPKAKVSRLQVGPFAQISFS